MDHSKFRPNNASIAKPFEKRHGVTRNGDIKEATSFLDRHDLSFGVIVGRTRLACHLVGSGVVIVLKKSEEQIRDGQLWWTAEATEREREERGERERERERKGHTNLANDTNLAHHKT